MSSSLLSRFPFRRLESIITPSLCYHLQKHGFVVVDNFLGSEFAEALREEILNVKRHKDSFSLMNPNHTHVLSPDGAERLLIRKKGILEAELSEGNVQKAAPLSTALLQDTTLRTMLSIHMPHVRLSSQAIKLQYNPGKGSCFPIHTDSEETIDARKVTAIYYCNRRDWEPGHGGELRLYPFPGMGYVDVEPIFDRLCLFSSQKMFHRVLPAQKERCCLTIWISQHGWKRTQSTTGVHDRMDDLKGDAGSKSPYGSSKEKRGIIRIVFGGDDSQEGLENDLNWVPQLGNVEPLRKACFKYVYRDEWAESLLESHPSDEYGVKSLIDKHWEEVGFVFHLYGDVISVGLCLRRRCLALGAEIDSRASSAATERFMFSQKARSTHLSSLH